MAINTNFIFKNNSLSLKEVNKMIYIRYQASIFGNFNDISPNSKLISKVMSDLHEYDLIPSAFNELDVNFNSVKRIEFFSSNKKINIRIAGGRIDIETNISPIQDISNEIKIQKLDHFLDDVKKLFNYQLNSFAKKGYRISLVTTIFDGDKQSSQIKSLYNKVINQNEYYKSKDVFEWNVRSVVHQNKEIMGNNETLNVLSEVSKGKGIISNLETKINSEFNGLIYVVDINTVPEQRETRIDIDFINEFYNHAKEIKYEIERGYFDEQ